MKYLRYAFLISLALVLIIVAVANKAPAELAFLPPDLANLIGMNWSIT
jgi:putative membrane protein